MTSPASMIKQCPMGHDMRNINSLFNPAASEHHCPTCNYSEPMASDLAEFLNKQERAMAAQQQGPPRPQQR